MITLEKLLHEQKYNGMSDIGIIRAFFELNDLEEEGFDLIHELTQSKINKLKYNQRIMREWSSYLPSKYLYENYDLEIADKLHTIELDFLSHGSQLSYERLQWAKENIPNIKLPQVYFRPLIEWLDKEGIRFKDEKPLKSHFYLENV